MSLEQVEDVVRVMCAQPDDATYEVAVVDQVADQVAVLRAGRVVERGVPGTVLRSPTDPYTRKLLASVPVADPVVQTRRRQASPAGLS